MDYEPARSSSGIHYTVLATDNYRFCIYLHPTGPAVRQLSTNMTSQAATLDLVGLPNDAIINFRSIFSIFLALFYVIIVKPGLERHGIRPSPHTIISIGFFSGAIGMALSAVNQHLIYEYSLCGSYANRCVSNPADSKISVLFQLPVYFFMANSEVLAVTTAVPYAYDKAPGNLRSVIMALFYFTMAIGGGVTQALVPLSRDPYLVWNYITASCLCLVATVGVWKTSR